MRKLRGRTLLLGAVATVAVGAGAGYAAIPSSNGTVNGCYEKKTGILRVIDKDAGKSCLSFETPIGWSVQGPPGATGAPGEKGATGADGNDGVSVTSTQVAPGDPTCASGGSRFTAAAGNVTHACNGADGGSLAAITDLGGLACTTSNGNAGSVAVATGAGSAIVLTCRGAGPCNGNPAVTHSNGFGQTWSDCTPAGIPGNAATYSHSLAMGAANAWAAQSAHSDVLCGSSAAIEVLANGSAALWVYGGPLAGRVSLTSGDTGVCPNSSDQTWG